jgi:hypothetical protein
MNPPADDQFASPDNYLHSFDGNAAIFVPMDRAAYHRSIFLDRRISPAINRPSRVDVTGLTASVPPPLQTNWIFHVAHCGSTLLARALDQLQTNLVLREPMALRQLAFDFDAERLAIVNAMLSRRYEPDLPTIVKANVPVNFLLPGLIELNPQTRCVFLYLELRDYLLATLRGEVHRNWLKNITTHLAPHLKGRAASTDAERAALVWTAQVEAFADAINRLPSARTINGEAFFAAPFELVRLSAEHLEVPLGEEQIKANVAGPLFTTYSKNPSVRFDNEARLARRAELERTLAPELELAQEWVAKNGETAVKAMDVIAVGALGREQMTAGGEAKV